MKRCPTCGANCFDDMEVCYGCLHQFDGPKAGGIPSEQIADALSVSPLLPREEALVPSANDAEVRLPEGNVVSQGDEWVLRVGVSKGQDEIVLRLGRMVR